MSTVAAIFAALGIAALLAAGRRRARSALGFSPQTQAPRHPPAQGAIPDVAGLVNHEVFAGFPAWVQRYEGSIPHLYQDVKGLVTCGIGNLVDPLDARALSLPWLRPDGAPASQEEIRADWQRVKALPAAMLASRYATPSALRLSPEGIAVLVRRQSAANVAQLARTFPDFPTYPPTVQTAILGLAWAMGAGFPRKFPTFTAAVKARDWRRAADNSRIRDANADRNAEHRRLLLAAAGVA